MKGLLFPHIFFATIAFVTGPFQFSTRLRKRSLRLHRLLGRTYVVSIGLGAPFAILLNIIHPMAGPDFSFEGITQGSVWLLTTVVAWQAARQRQIPMHQLWMARSYSVTFIFVLSRVGNSLAFFQQMRIETFTGFLWFLLVFSLLVPDLLMQGKALWPRQPHAK